VRSSIVFPASLDDRSRIRFSDLIFGADGFWENLAALALLASRFARWGRDRPRAPSRRSLEDSGVEKVEARWSRDSNGRRFRRRARNSFGAGFVVDRLVGVGRGMRDDSLHSGFFMFVLRKPRREWEKSAVECSAVKKTFFFARRCTSDGAVNGATRTKKNAAQTRLDGTPWRKRGFFGVRGVMGSSAQRFTRSNGRRLLSGAGLFDRVEERSGIVHR